MHFAKLIAAILILFASIARGLDAKAVYAKISPSTVLIEDLNTHGSGIVLTQDGLILTNFHVVAAHIDLKVKLQVKFGNKTALTEIDEVRLMKIHPEYDLALLKAEPPKNGTFIPALMLPKNEPLGTGSKCYAIGNPGGLGGKSLDLSITEGLVSSAKRMIEGSEFVQISAALNPGNSGGPVCDDQGRVFGITTWKLENTEGIGFAIPSQKLALTEFIELQQKKENYVEMKRAEDAGRQFYTMATQLNGKEREKCLYLSAECYLLMAEAAPSKMGPIYNLAVLYLDLGQPETSKKYLKAVQERDPTYSAAYHLRGIILMEENKSNEAEACQLWWKGVEYGKFGTVACLDDIATTMANQKKDAAAAYLLQWSETLAAATNTTAGARANVWTTLKKTLPSEQFAAIRQMKGGFSKADADLLAAGKPIATLTSVANKSPTGSTTATGSPKPLQSEESKIDATKVGSVTTAQMTDLIKRTRDKFAPQLVEIPDKVLTAPLPDEPRRAMLANLGWQLILHFPNLAKLGVFNLATGKFDGFIECPDSNALFTVGGNVLAMYLPSSDLTELYDLNTLEKKVSTQCVYPGTPRFIGMGLLNPMRIFVICEANKEFPGDRFQYTYALINLPNWTPFILSGNVKYSMHLTEGAALEGAMDELGVCCVVSRPKVSPPRNGLFFTPARQCGFVPI